MGSRSIVPAIRKARDSARGGIAFVASITGTDADPQNRARQQAALERAGVRVMETNACAARLAGLIASKGTH